MYYGLKARIVYMFGCSLVILICVDADLKPHMSNSAPSAIPISYGFQGSSKKIEIPNGRVGVIIGKGGETIKYLQLQSGAKIQVTRDMDADPNSTTRMVELMGTPDQIAKAEQLINDVLSEVGLFLILEFHGVPLGAASI